MKKVILVIILSITTFIIGIVGIKTEMKGKFESQISETKDFNGVFVCNELQVKGNDLSGEQTTLY